MRGGLYWAASWFPGPWHQQRACWHSGHSANSAGKISAKDALQTPGQVRQAESAVTTRAGVGWRWRAECEHSSLVCQSHHFTSPNSSSHNLPTQGRLGKKEKEKLVAFQVTATGEERVCVWGVSCEVSPNPCAQQPSYSAQGALMFGEFEG